MRGLYIQRASAMAPIAKDSEVQNSAAPASTVGATQPKVQPVALEIAVTVNGSRLSLPSTARAPFTVTAISSPTGCTFGCVAPTVDAGAAEFWTSESFAMGAMALARWM